MKHRRKRPLPVKLAKAQEQFEQWRSQHPPRTRVPQPLWSVAAELAVEFGLNQTARALKLNYYGLKKRMDPAASNPPAPTRVNEAFLELAVPINPVSPTSECMIECQDATGTQIRIQLKGIQGPDLAILCGQLWRP